MPITAAEIASANANSALRENRELKKQVSDLEDSVKGLEARVENLEHFLDKTGDE